MGVGGRWQQQLGQVLGPSVQGLGYVGLSGGGKSPKPPPLPWESVRGGTGFIAQEPKVRYCNVGS